jgi:flagellar motor component MotA
MIDKIKDKMFKKEIKKPIDVTDEEIREKIFERAEQIRELQDEINPVLEEYGDLLPGTIIGALIGLALSAVEIVYDEDEEEGKMLRRVAINVFEMWREENGI